MQTESAHGKRSDFLDLGKILDSLSAGQKKRARYQLSSLPANGLLPLVSNSRVLFASEAREAFPFF